MFRNHGISRMFMCRCCNWAFPDKTSLHIHMQSMLRHGLPGDVNILAKSTTEGDGGAGVEQHKFPLNSEQIAALNIAGNNANGSSPLYEEITTTGSFPMKNPLKSNHSAKRSFNRNAANDNNRNKNNDNNIKNLNSCLSLPTTPSAHQHLINMGGQHHQHRLSAGVGGAGASGIFPLFSAANDNNNDRTSHEEDLMNRFRQAAATAAAAALSSSSNTTPPNNADNSPFRQHQQLLLPQPNMTGCGRPSQSTFDQHQHLQDHNNASAATIAAVAAIRAAALSTAAAEHAHHHLSPQNHLLSTWLANNFPTSNADDMNYAPITDHQSSVSFPPLQLPHHRVLPNGLLLPTTTLMSNNDNNHRNRKRETNGVKTVKMEKSDEAMRAGSLNDGEDDNGAAAAALMTSEYSDEDEIEVRMANGQEEEETGALMISEGDIVDDMKKEEAEVDIEHIRSEKEETDSTDSVMVVNKDDGKAIRCPPPSLPSLTRKPSPTVAALVTLKQQQVKRNAAGLDLANFLAAKGNGRLSHQNVISSLSSPMSGENENSRRFLEKKPKTEMVTSAVLGPFSAADEAVALGGTTDENLASSSPTYSNDSTHTSSTTSTSCTYQGSSTSTNVASSIPVFNTSSKKCLDCQTTKTRLAVSENRNRDLNVKISSLMSDISRLETRISGYEADVQRYEEEQLSLRDQCDASGQRLLDIQEKAVRYLHQYHQNQQNQTASKILSTSTSSEEDDILLGADLIKDLFTDLMIMIPTSSQIIPSPSMSHPQNFTEENSPKTKSETSLPPLSCSP